MIKCEVVFNDDDIICNGKKIEISVHEDYEIFYLVGDDWFSSLDTAIKYCMEQQNDPTTD